MPKKFILPAVIAGSMVVGGAAGAAIGIPALSGAETRTVQAQQGQDQQGRPGPRDHGGDRIEAAAKALNLSTDELLAKLQDGKTTIADIAQQQNVDLNTVIDAIAAAERAHIEEFVNNPMPQRGGHGPDGHGPGGPGGRGDHGPMGKGIDAAAAALGISADDLKAALRDGKSIADVAKDKGVDVNAVIDALVAEAEKHIDEEVASGEHTQAEADQMKQGLRERITAMVNGERPSAGPDGRGPGGPGGKGGRHGGPPPGMGAPGADNGNGSGTQTG